MTWASILSAVGQLLAKLLAYLLAWKAGKETARDDQLEADRRATDAAAAIRDRLRTDPEFRDRVRDRFRSQ